MPANLPLATLLTGIARGRGGAEMMLELLAILHNKGVLNETEVQRVVNVLAADIHDFNSELQQSQAASVLKG